MLPHTKRRAKMAKTPIDGYDVLSDVFGYDPETGVITWKVRASQRTRIGDEAGLVKNARTAGVAPRLYRYVGYNGWSTTAARLAWLLAYKEWPQRSILYIDGDTLNTKIANLKLGDFTSGDSNGALPQRKMNRSAARHYGWKRYYGLTSEDYGRMLAEQGSVCAICFKPEIRITPKGDLTTLHVDHDHVTGKVRALLCYKCNSMLGGVDDSPEILRAAADYIEKHRAKDAV